MCAAVSCTQEGSCDIRGMVLLGKVRITEALGCCELCLIVSLQCKHWIKQVLEYGMRNMSAMLHVPALPFLVLHMYMLCTHTHTHLCTRTPYHTYTHIHTHTCTRPTHLHTNTHTYTHACLTMSSLQSTR